jgi:hypothetical protein
MNVPLPVEYTPQFLLPKDSRNRKSGVRKVAQLRFHSLVTVVSALLRLAETIDVAMNPTVHLDANTLLLELQVSYLRTRGWIVPVNRVPSPHGNRRRVGRATEVTYEPGKWTGAEGGR